MTANKFDQIVEARAKERAQKKITDFKDEVIKSVRKLFNQPYGIDPLFKEVFRIMGSDDTSKDWPVILWTVEEESVRKELLSIMDEMQRALIAAEGLIEYEDKQKNE